MMRSKNKWIPFTSAGICLISISLAMMTGCGQKPVLNYDKMEIDLWDRNGVVQQRLESVEVGDSLSIGFQGLPANAAIQVYLNDDLGQEWSYARVFADKRGEIAPFLFWYHSGVIGTTSRKFDFRPDPAFETFEEGRAFFAEHPLKLTIRDLKGRLIRAEDLPIGPRRSPMVYPSNEKGVLVNAFDQTREDIYASGKNFPAGATVRLFAVTNQYVWNPGDPLMDISGEGGAAEIETIELAPNQTSFTAKIWNHANGRPGSFDIVARIDQARNKPVLQANDILSYGEDTGMIYYIIINGNIVIESAGRMKSAPAKFEFSDAFEKQENVYAAVDPSDVPAVHSGGNYAAYYVVEHQQPSYWDGPNPTLTDVSGGIEIQRVKYWCINASRRLVWPNASQTDPIKAYDLIVDFGSVPAMTAAGYVQDNIYNKGTDFIDGYAADAGFWVYEDPSAMGTYNLGQVELDEPNGISGITDSNGLTGPTQNISLAWARIMYPATMTGTGTPVSGTLPRYPIALFLHGRHRNCDNDGAGPGLGGSYTFNCATANRVPSHEGYNYIMERLASQGIFSISISAHDIQPGLGVWDYNARGRLILKFLDKLRDWNNNGTDPFGGIFAGKLDLLKIALSGHSRGGEGVVAAQELNAAWPSPHGIVAVNAIAPTDQNSVSYLMTRAPYFLLLGARDGDLDNMQGFRTYDRAYPDGASVRHPKTLAFVYGANHNYFNTIWTDSAALGSPNPWTGAVDDGLTVGGVPLMASAVQRQVALTTICAFFRWHLQSIEPYREIFTGRLQPAAMPNASLFWTYQDDERKAVDNFEQTPLNASQNTLIGTVSAPGFTTFAERLLNYNDSDYPGGFPVDSQFFHDTLGLRLAWAAPQTYTSLIPAGERDFSAFTHLTMRVAKRVSGPPAIGSAINLYVNIQDGDGDKALWDLRSDQFDPVPHPYFRTFLSNQALLTGVRIPLRNFTMNNSGVDLNNIVQITIRTEGSGEIGIDDIEFGN